MGLAHSRSRPACFGGSSGLSDCEGVRAARWGPRSAPKLDPAVVQVIEFVGTDVICRLRGLPDAGPEVR